jgi:hypothetical protein
MDNNFLDKVLDQIVSETIIDHDRYNRITYPFDIIFPRPFLSPPYQFYGHCMNVYGLNEDEVKYVWDEYKRIIENKIEKRMMVY